MVAIFAQEDMLGQKQLRAPDVPWFFVLVVYLPIAQWIFD